MYERVSLIPILLGGVMINIRLLGYWCMKGLRSKTLTATLSCTPLPPGLINVWLGRMTYVGL